MMLFIYSQANFVELKSLLQSAALLNYMQVVLENRLLILPSTMMSAWSRNNAVKKFTSAKWKWPLNCWLFKTNGNQYLSSDHIWSKGIWSNAYHSGRISSVLCAQFISRVIQALSNCVHSLFGRALVGGCNKYMRFQANRVLFKRKHEHANSL